jgi:catalase
MPSPEVAEPPLELEGAMWRFDPKDDPTDDCFRDGGDLYRLMSEEKRQILIDNTARNMNGVTDNIKYRHAVHCLKADEEYGTRMTKALMLDIDEVRRLAKLDNAGLIAATMPK